MAASKKLDSCSPIPSRLTNHYSRNSETSNPMRRSSNVSPFVKPSIISNQKGGGGCFNPNTPVNTPSDYHRRNSISRENTAVALPDHEDKENGIGQNWKSVRVRSPAKGAKNFMSPTISAASKINASPRKKILADGNEQTRTSISFSDAKSPLMEDSHSKPNKVLNQKKEVSFDSTVTYLGDSDDSKSEEHADLMVDSSSKDDLDLSSENLTMEKDCVNLDPSFEISPRVSSSFPNPALAPLDADPSVATYDPKTNYLSPRPQFLHYRPNPRIELYLNKERDGQPTEESECSSETEVSEAEDSHSDDSRKESDASSSDEVKEEEELEELLLASEPISISTSVEEEELLVSEPNPISTSVEKAEEKRVSKSRLYTRIKFTALLSVLTVGFLYVSVFISPITDPSVFNNFTFLEPYVPPELSEYNRQTFDVLAQKVQLWLHQSLCYTHNLINSFRGVHILGPFQYANLTLLLEDGIVDGQFVFDQSILGSKVKYEEKVLESVKGTEVNINLADEDDQPRAADESIEVTGDKNDWDFSSAPDSEEFSVPESEEANLHAGSEMTGTGILGSKVKNEEKVLVESIMGAEVKFDLADEEDQPRAADENIEVTGDKNDWDFNTAPDSEEFSVPESEEANLRPGSEVTETGKSAQEEVIQESSETAANVVELQSNMVLEDQSVLIPQAAEIQPEILNSMSSQGINDISSAGIESPGSENNYAGAATENLRSSELVNTRSAQIMAGISLIVFSLLGTTAFVYMKSQTPTTRNAASAVDQMPAAKKLEDSPMPVAAEQTDIVGGESCPSEMSSFSLSYSKKGTSEAQSCERKPRRNIRRRDSMASPDYSVGSMGSPSYGSFTTYEKIHGLHGNEDEEVITPVRRSSRIRNQVTSP
ncbi:TRANSMEMBRANE PROTEIN [Salix purpurea]|uniref:TRANSMEMBRANE PROTEIN n=1 Tax=Salix purpurea TaxID=77065 RepID=A0A9Q0VTV7_SALPP|nr:TRANSMEMBRANE PROTEIN [Salix purpurea]